MLRATDRARPATRGYARATDASASVVCAAKQAPGDRTVARSGSGQIVGALRIACAPFPSTTAIHAREPDAAYARRRRSRSVPSRARAHRPAHPDIQYHFFPFLLEGWRPSRSESGFCVCVGTLRERSRGTLRLACADPTAPPLIDFNYLDDPRDLDDLRTCVHQAREVVSQHAFDPFRGDAVRPWAAARDDAEIDAVIRESAESAFHPCGTCRMGDDPMSVVDPQCRVHGMEGLRVVDSSIIPSIVSGNLNAPTMMVGEKASDMILGRTALAPSNAGFFGAA